MKREALAVMPEARRSPRTQPGGGQVWYLEGPWGTGSITDTQL